MEQIAVFQEKVTITPIDLRPDITNFDEILIDKLRRNLEGKCSKHGFVIPGSLELLSRSMGMAEKGRGTADFLYYIKAQGKVYNPPDGIEVEGEIQLKNKMGCYVIIDNAVRIMIPRDLHIGNHDFDSLELGDRIRIQIKKSQYRANASHILSIGQYMGRVGGAGAASASAVRATPALAEDDDESVSASADSADAADAAEDDDQAEETEE